MEIINDLKNINENNIHEIEIYENEEDHTYKNIVILYEDNKVKNSSINDFFEIIKKLSNYE